MKKFVTCEQAVEKKRGGKRGGGWLKGRYLFNSNQNQSHSTHHLHLHPLRLHQSLYPVQAKCDPHPKVDKNTSLSCSSTQLHNCSRIHTHT